MPGLTRVRLASAGAEERMVVDLMSDGETTRPTMYVIIGLPGAGKTVRARDDDRVFTVCHPGSPTAAVSAHHGLRSAGVCREPYPLDVYLEGGRVALVDAGLAAAGLAGSGRGHLVSRRRARADGRPAGATGGELRDERCPRAASGRRTGS